MLEEDKKGNPKRIIIPTVESKSRNKKGEIIPTKDL